jgi:hypothetical protein
MAALVAADEALRVEQIQEEAVILLLPHRLKATTAVMEAFLHLIMVVVVEGALTQLVLTGQVPQEEMAEMEPHLPYQEAA